MAVESGGNHGARLRALRESLESAGIDGMIVPRGDSWLGESVPPCAERLAWLTGFTGSAGLAVILQDRAALFTDGRYTLQVRQQVDADMYAFEPLTKGGAAQWLAAHAQRDCVIGYDPALHAPDQIETWQDICAVRGVILRALEHNPVDSLWRDRPPPPASCVMAFPEQIAGRTAAEKSTDIASAIVQAGGFAFVLAAPDSLAWLLNVRGTDLPHTPVALSFGIAYAAQDSPAQPAIRWFIDPARVPRALIDSWGDRIALSPPEDFTAALRQLGEESRCAARPVLMDFSGANESIRRILAETGADVKHMRDPCILPRACKTRSEQESMRQAHLWDGVALVQFLHWLEESCLPGGLTLLETDVQDRLESFRRANSAYRGGSFDTICGFGANGAIVHYRACPHTARALEQGGLLLVDSGGQYLEGTTDVTRTIAIGTPTPEMQTHYTYVLKGHIALARAIFPEGTLGAQLDGVTRAPLWEAGLDYAHGTGHGVGCFLSVHEDAASLSPRGQEPLAEGMILSNEPGYYRTGHYGIRIENLLLVQSADQKNLCTQAPMLGFETLTLAPYDRRLIRPECLQSAEIAWINSYHERIEQILSPHPSLTAETRAWLAQATAPLAET